MNTVFVTYAHDDEPHKTAVLTLSELLVRNGIDVGLDLWSDEVRRDWGAWATERITTAGFVLVVASPGYRRAGDGLANPTGRRGVQAEAALIRDLLHRDRRTWTPKLLPVVLPGHDIEDVPLFLQPSCADHYVITELTDAGVEDLLRTITGQPRRVRPPLGDVPVLPPGDQPTRRGNSSRTPCRKSSRASAVSARWRSNACWNKPSNSA